MYCFQNSFIEINYLEYLVRLLKELLIGKIIISTKNIQRTIKRYSPITNWRLFVITFMWRSNIIIQLCLNELFWRVVDYTRNSLNYGRLNISLSCLLFYSMLKHIVWGILTITKMHIIISSLVPEFSLFFYLCVKGDFSILFDWIFTWNGKSYHFYLFFWIIKSLVGIVVDIYSVPSLGY